MVDDSKPLTTSAVPLIDGCPAQGIFYDVEPAAYFSWNAISNSKLHAAKRSMLHYHTQRPVEETSAMRLGSLSHTGKFEPQSLGERYVVMPRYEDQVRRPDGGLYDSPKGSKAYKELVSTFSEKNRDRTVVTAEQYDAMLGMVDALGRHEVATDLLTGGLCEVSIVWRDPQTGLMLKGRTDHWQRDRRLVSDFKTGWDIDGVEQQIENRGYFRQLGMYCDGFELLTGERHTGAIVVAETTRPYAVKAAPLCDEYLDAGRAEYRRLLGQIAECVQTNNWPGVDSPALWTRPAWAVERPTLDIDWSGVVMQENAR